MPAPTFLAKHPVYLSYVRGVASKELVTGGVIDRISYFEQQKFRGNLNI
jgi:hypothetical protein